MTIQEAHYDFKLKIDKVDTLAKRNFKPWEIDWIINEAIKIFTKQRYGINNIRQKGFESIQKRRDDLRTLQIKSPTTKQPGLAPIRRNGDVYEFRISDLSFPYWFLTRATVEAEKGSCTKVFKRVFIAEHDDLTDALNYKFYKPDFDWGRAVVVEARTDETDRNDGSFYVYGAPDFEITTLYPEYIKKPDPVWIGGYDSLDGVYRAGIDSPKMTDLPEHTHNEIIDTAVLECSRIIESPNFYQLKEAKLKINE